VRPILLQEVKDAIRVRGQLEGLACSLLCGQEPDPHLLARFKSFVDVGKRLLAAARRVSRTRIRGGDHQLACAPPERNTDKRNTDKRNTDKVEVFGRLFRI
jgi:hypothetical protein